MRKTWNKMTTKLVICLCIVVDVSSWLVTFQPKRSLDAHSTRLNTDLLTLHHCSDIITRLSHDLRLLVIKLVQHMT